MMDGFKPIAYYLPQFHPILENDQWWGKGFTEWTNVTKAKPLFEGHYQPRFPADLGYYDLRVPEVREEQAKMAKEHGIHGFCYYHYWFGNGKQLLERPFNEVLRSGKPDFPFMLCWANQTWKGVWFGASKDKVLIEQKYPGKKDYIVHFEYLLEAFKDKRYITYEGKPVFNVYMPMDIPDLKEFVEIFRCCAAESGLKGIYLLASNCPISWNPIDYGFDGIISNNFNDVRYKSIVGKNENGIIQSFKNKLKLKINPPKVENRTKPFIIDYKEFSNFLLDWKEIDFDYFPLIVPNWDNSARASNKSLIINGSTPELWENQLKKAKEYQIKSNTKEKLIFIKSWNEWAEGNYLEPDSKFGMSYLQKVREVFLESLKFQMK